MPSSERTIKARRLLSILKTPPAFVFDILEYTLFGEYRLNPIFLEQLLKRRRQFNEDLSLQDNLIAIYGKDVSDLAESLI